MSDQFLDNGLVEVCNELANRGVRVIVAGLDMDSLSAKRFSAFLRLKFTISFSV